MRKTTLLLLSPVIALAASCSEDDLTPQQALLDLEPFDNPDKPAYAGTHTEPTDTGDMLVIDLGRVPFFTSRTATFELVNRSQLDLVISAINLTNVQEGADWLLPRFIKQEGDTDRMVVPVSESRKVEVGYEPPGRPAHAEGPAWVEIEIISNATNGSHRRVRIEAESYFEGGAPDIEILYYTVSEQEAAYRGPEPTVCDSDLFNSTDDNGDGVIDGCGIGDSLDIGTVSFGQQNTARVYIHNASGCTPDPLAPACATCVLTLAQDTLRQNVGVGFKAGTNPGFPTAADPPLFAFQGSTATPADLHQVDATCTGPSVAPLSVVFKAPDTAGNYGTTIVIESNDPDEPLIEIRVTAASINVPVAIADFKAPDGTGSNYTNPNDIEPLDRVYLDGRAKGTIDSTHDPRDPTNTALIDQYAWELIEYPPDADPGTFAWQYPQLGIASVFVPLAGHYVARLTVRNTAGMFSLDTEAARVEWSAIPTDGLHLQLVWDSPTNDQDLHLTNTVVNDNVCNEPDDCYYGNKRPQWFSAFPAGGGPNPTLDRDDTNGLGPENINIETPEPGTYRIFVHYWGGYNSLGQSSTLNTVRVWINSIQVGEYSRVLDRSGAVWAVATVSFLPSGQGTITPYPSDAAGETGALEYMQSCSPPSGWTFPP